MQKKLGRSLFIICCDIDRCRSQIVHRLHQLHDIVTKRVSVTASLQQVSNMLDDVASNCRQLSADIGPSRDAAAALVEMSQVWIDVK